MTGQGRAKTVFSWLGLTLYALLAVAALLLLVPFGGVKALNVLTGSMKPALQPGDLVVVRQAPLRSLKPGDIITYRNPANHAQSITHRLVELKTDGPALMVVTQGDANLRPDPAVVGGNVIGKVVWIGPGLGRVASWLHQPLGLAAVVIIPGIIVIAAEVKRLRGLVKSSSIKPASGSGPTLGPNPAAIVAILALVTLVGGVAYAAQTSVVTLTGNRLSVIASSPTPSPTPAPSATPTPTATPTTTPNPTTTPTPCAPPNNHNTVIINNQNNQTAQSSSGNASNSNTTTTNVTIDNGCAKP